VHRRATPRPPRPAAGESNGFVAGQRVCHAEFGPGTIRAVEGNGERTKLTVRFDRAGFKKLIARFAALQRLS
jgi:DNA helicase-2/ATP-dependent DNA helicase PcrA